MLWLSVIVVAVGGMVWYYLKLKRSNAKWSAPSSKPSAGLLRLSTRDWSRYPRLHTVYTILTVVGGLVIAIVLLGGLLVFVFIADAPESDARTTALLATGASCLAGIVLGAIPWALGELLGVLVDIEHNTSITAQRLASQPGEEVR